jgi:hypothetical protein
VINVARSKGIHDVAVINQPGIVESRVVNRERPGRYKAAEVEE